MSRDYHELNSSDLLPSVKKSDIEPKRCEYEHASIRERVYEYIQDQMKYGNLLPGSVLNLKAISQKLGISSTPLRDSLIRLEAEGYLTIYPRSKVVINSLELEDFPFLYEIMGSLEYTVIAANMRLYTSEIIEKMRQYNQSMNDAIQAGDMAAYDTVHYQFHSIFFDVYPNIFVKRILTPIKNRLWDFPRKNFIKEWYLDAIKEHSMIVDAIEKNSHEALMHVLKELHWGFEHNKDFIKKVYNFN